MAMAMWPAQLAGADVTHLLSSPWAAQVTAVLVTPEGDIVSASLDKTIRIWRGGQCTAVLQGHEAAVLCLLQLPNGDLLSGSGDCTIRVWSGGKCTHTIPAHSDSVRWGGRGRLVGRGVGGGGANCGLRVRSPLASSPAHPARAALHTAL